MVTLASQAGWASSSSQAGSKITAYLLVSVDPATNTDAIRYLTDKLVPEIAAKQVHIDRLVLSFLNPNMDPQKINADVAQNNLQQLIIDAGLLPTASASEVSALQSGIAQLRKDNVQVYFAVGGWAYSCYDPEKTAAAQPSCTANFPLTPDMVTNFNTAKLPTGSKLAQVQPTAAYTTKQYTDTWAKAAKALGADGLDLDYEENWFVAATSYHLPVLTINPAWASNPNGPYVIPYSVIKYATILQALENTAQSNGLGVTIAASAAGAYDVHDHIGGSNFWCPVSAYGNSVCGEDTTYPYSQLTTGGNLKGILYDMANYQVINNMSYQGKKYSFHYPEAIFAGLLNKLDAIDVMTYDLDDGYDGLTSSWCIGKNADGQFSSRDPSTQGYQDIDCAVKSQAETIIAMYKQNVIDKISGNKPHLAFGLEAGFPNYPINIDASLAGGGNITPSRDPSTDPHYRWNDPFVAFDLPLKEGFTPDNNTQQWIKNHQTSDVYSGVADVHSQFLVVDKNLFTTMQTAGADSLILWSLYNADYDQHMSSASWDYQQLNPFNQAAFGKDVAAHAYTQALLSVLFQSSASPEDMLKTANAFYYAGK